MPVRRADEETGGSSPEPRPEPSSSDMSSPPRLTDRQLEILVHVARGKTNRQIGGALGISDRTVRNHLRTIAKKLSSSDRTHAVVLAIEQGWIAIPIEPERGPETDPREPTSAADQSSARG